MITCVPEDATRQPAIEPLADRDYFSFSAMRLYQQCPLRYYFKYHLGLPEPVVSASLLFGSAMHQAIEWHFRELLSGHPAPETPALLAAYRQAWSTRAGEPIAFGAVADEQSLDNLAERLLTKFCDSPYAWPAGQILGVEETLRGPLVAGLPDLLGRVDLIVETADELILSDWKTSRSAWNAEQCDQAADQLCLYAELARELVPGKRVRLEFIVLVKTKQVTIEKHTLLANPDKIARAKRTWEQVWRAIQGDHFFPVPSVMHCPSCPYHGPCGRWPLEMAQRAA